MIFATLDQKAFRIARLLAKEIVPIFGVPECLLSDCGTNLLSHLMKDICNFLGIKKLNTTGYHPHCNGMVKRFNRTLIAMLRKHADKYGKQWDKHLHGVLWAYRNTPHESTGEKPSYLLFGFDCRTPTEAALLPTLVHNAALEITDYRKELTESLQHARNLATTSIQKAHDQKHYKKYYDKKAASTTYEVGDLVLVNFPQDEIGSQRKLACTWHSPYHVVTKRDPDVEVSEAYFPQEGNIQIHQSRVKSSPPGFPSSGYYWYGTCRKGAGRPPKDNSVTKTVLDPPPKDGNSAHKPKGARCPPKQSCGNSVINSAMRKKVKSSTNSSGRA